MIARPPSGSARAAGSTALLRRARIATRALFRRARVATRAFAALSLVAACAQAQPPGASGTLAAALSGFTRVNAPAERFRLEDGVLRVEAGGGWLRSDRRYDDFVLTAEVRFLTEDADSGIFVRAEGDAEFGPGWPGNSYQVQLRNPLGESPFPPVGGLFRHGLPGGATRFDEAAARDAFTGTGEWQTVVISVTGDALRVELNGATVTEADGIENASGYVGIQSESGTLELRSLDIEPR